MVDPVYVCSEVVWQLPAMNFDGTVPATDSALVFPSLSQTVLVEKARVWQR